MILPGEISYEMKEGTLLHFSNMCYSTSVFKLYYIYYDKTVDKLPLQNYEREIYTFLLGETIDSSATKWNIYYILFP